MIMRLLTDSIYLQFGFAPRGRSFCTVNNASISAFRVLSLKNLNTFLGTVPSTDGQFVVWNLIAVYGGL